LSRDYYGAGVRLPLPSVAPKRHVAAASLNAGDLTSIVFGTSRDTPPLPIAIENSCGLDGGGPTVGSGKPPMPWVRMHFDTTNNRSLTCSDAGPSASGLPPGSSFAHRACAALNDGEDALIPELGLSWTPPSGPGSGKFGTPWLLMQSTYARNCGLALLAALTGLEEPHAAIANADPTRRSRTTGSGRGMSVGCTAAPVTAP
jgi:hypothetical protein